jgi:hypothetical protein
MPQIANDRKGEVRPEDAPVEPAHLADVLLAAHGVDDRAGAEEQQRLEEGVRHQMEDRRPERSNSRRQHHVPQLRHRRVRQHLLDVVLRHADGGGEQRR